MSKQFIDFDDTTFNCPYCNKQFNDSADKYCKRINQNKSFTTKVKCECQKTFNLTVDYMSKFVSYV